MEAFSRRSAARTMPRLEFRMKERIVSRSSEGGKPASTRAQPSEMLNPW